MLDNNISPDLIKNLTLQEKIQLCKDLRRYIYDVTIKNGGHLSSNLGTIELTVVLHSVFETPKDKFVFDVGHQSYAHKIITGRMSDFQNLRCENGISGFPRPDESLHDAFIGGHSSISISAALGILKAMQLNNDNHHVIAVIGDGAFTGGEAYEGLNNAGKIGGNLIVVLNDNEMSISKNSGAVASYLTQMRSTKKYYDTKVKIKDMLSKSAIGKELAKSVIGTKELVKFAIYQSNIFENLGFKYLGPIDGHNISELTEALTVAKMMQMPCIVHIKTVKGKGYRPAEQNSGEYHGISKQNRTEEKNTVSENFSDVFGKYLVKLAEKDDKICAVTAAMKYGTGLQYFSKAFRNRFFDVGIAEPHALTFSCGLASQGMVPVFAVYSTFLQRAYDQIIHDAAIEKYHIVLSVDRAGVVGEDGETHQGIFDVSMLSSIPNVTIYSPNGISALKKSYDKAIYECDGIVAVRYPRGVAFDDSKLIELGEIHNDGEYILYKKATPSNSLVITYGRLTNNIEFDAADFDVLQLVKIYPLDDEIVDIIKNYQYIFFFEEGIKQGGIGEKLLVKLFENDFLGEYQIIAIDAKFVKCADSHRQLSLLNLDYESMKKIVSEKNKK